MENTRDTTFPSVVGKVSAVRRKVVRRLTESLPPTGGKVSAGMNYLRYPSEKGLNIGIFLLIFNNHTKTYIKYRLPWIEGFSAMSGSIFRPFHP